MAGSTFSFSRVIGTNVPNKDANITIENRASDTASVMFVSVPLNMLNPNTIKAIIHVLINDTPSYFRICLPALFISSEPLASP